VTATVRADIRPHEIDRVIALAGDLDLDSPSSVLETSEFAIAASDSRRVWLDLSGVTFVDVYGLRLLVRIRAMTLALGRTLHLLGVSPQLMRLMQVSGLAEEFGLGSDLGRC
jgi:anti-sigma B factor antagonist